MRTVAEATQHPQRLGHSRKREALLPARSPHLKPWISEQNE